MRDSVLRLSVSGRHFDVLPQVISGTGRLATFLNPLSSERDRAAVSDGRLGDVYFFARNAAAFEAILDCLLDPTSGLHPPPSLCQRRFQSECAGWGVEAEAACPCLASSPLPCSSLGACATVLTTVDDPHPAAPLTLPAQETLLDTAEEKEEPRTGQRCLATQRYAIWTYIEDPHSSKIAGLFAVISISFVLLSVSCLIIGSLPECQVPPDNEPHISLVVLEYVCIAWFTFEYALRLVTCPSKASFCASPLDIIDLISIVPFYIEFSLQVAGITYKTLDNLKGALLVMRLLRVLRVARIFKLARYSAAMKSCGKTLKESRREVGMLVIFVGIMIILFSTTVYFLEKDVPGTEFVSVPATFWWCVITITTVGYGDITPVTVGGRLVASLASIAGVVVLAFPITVIVENFYRYYRKVVYKALKNTHRSAQYCSSASLQWT